MAEVENLLLCFCVLIFYCWTPCDSTWSSYSVIDSVRIQEYSNKNYTILSVNYTSSIPETYDYIFRNACRYDLGSELASFHSIDDYWDYFDLVETYPRAPYGLRFMFCQIGLWNQTNSQSNYIWMDGTPYDWGIRNASASFPWDGAASKKWLDCVYVDNKPAQRKWSQYDCFSPYYVNCGVCNTPTNRDYKMGITGEIMFNDGYSDNSIKNITIYFQLNGTDLFDNGINSIEYIEYKISTTANSMETITFEEIISNNINLGNIDSMTIIVTGDNLNENVTYDVIIDSIRMNYLNTNAFNLSFSINSDTDATYISNDNRYNSCKYTIVHFIYHNNTISNSNPSIYQCPTNLQQLFVPTPPTTSPTSYPTSEPSISPSDNPTIIPSTYPSRQPYLDPSRVPSTNPTNVPTQVPIMLSTDIPSMTPTINPTNIPAIAFPTTAPSSNPSVVPFSAPAAVPTRAPTRISSSLTTTQQQPLTSGDSGGQTSSTTTATASKVDSPVDSGDEDESNSSVLDKNVIAIIVVGGSICVFVCCVVFIGCMLYLRKQKKEIENIKRSNTLSTFATIATHSPMSTSPIPTHTSRSNSFHQMSATDFDTPGMTPNNNNNDSNNSINNNNNSTSPHSKEALKNNGNNRNDNGYGYINGGRSPSAPGSVSSKNSPQSYMGSSNSNLIQNNNSTSPFGNNNDSNGNLQPGSEKDITKFMFEDNNNNNDTGHESMMQMVGAAYQMTKGYGGNNNNNNNNDNNDYYLQNTSNMAAFGETNHHSRDNTWNAETYLTENEGAPSGEKDHAPK